MDQNGSHTGHIRICVWYIFVQSMLLSLKWYHNFYSNLQFDKVMIEYVLYCIFVMCPLLGNCYLRKTHQESWLTRLDGMKCKGHSNHSNHAQNLIKLGTIWEYTQTNILWKFDFTFVFDPVLGCRWIYSQHGPWNN